MNFETWSRSRVTIKASSLLAVTVIWASMISAVIIEPDGWWSLLFAGLATGAVGIGFWRRLGLSRLIAISGIWAGTAVIVANGEPVWPSIFAFLATAALAYTPSRRAAFLLGAAAAFVWLATAVIVTDQHDGAGIAIFAFLTVAMTVGSHSRHAKGVAIMVSWGIATAIILAVDGMYWLTAIAWLLSTTSFGIPEWHFPRGIEWDFREHDDSRTESF